MSPSSPPAASDAKSARGKPRRGRTRKTRPDTKSTCGQGTAIGGRLRPEGHPVDREKHLGEVGARFQRLHVSLLAGEALAARGLRVDQGRGNERRSTDQDRQSRREHEVGGGARPPGRPRHGSHRDRHHQGGRRQHRLRPRRQESKPSGRGRGENSRAPFAAADANDAEQDPRHVGPHHDRARPGCALDQPGRQHPRDGAEERRQGVHAEPAQEQEREEARQPDVEQSERVVQTVHRLPRQEQGCRRGIEDRRFLLKEQRVTAELPVQPERRLTRPQRALHYVPDRQVLVVEVEVKERARSRRDGPKRGENEDREGRPGEPGRRASRL